MTGTTVGSLSRRRLRLGLRVCSAFSIAGVLLLAAMLFAAGRGETHLFEYLPIVSGLAGGPGTIVLLVQRRLSEAEESA